MDYKYISKYIKENKLNKEEIMDFIEGCLSNELLTTYEYSNLEKELIL